MASFVYYLEKALSNFFGKGQKVGGLFALLIKKQNWAYYIVIYIKWEKPNFHQVFDKTENVKEIKCNFFKCFIIKCNFNAEFIVEINVSREGSEWIFPPK